MSERNDLGSGSRTGVDAGVVDSAKRLKADAQDLSDALSEKTRTVVGRIAVTVTRAPAAGASARYADGKKFTSRLRAGGEGDLDEVLAWRKRAEAELRLVGARR